MTVQLVDFTAVDLKANVETRTLTGLLLPFGEVSRPARDPITGAVGRFRFSAGTVTAAPVADHILNFGHDRERLEYQLGTATALEETPEGWQVTYKVAKTPEGDRVLALADAGVLRSFSAEVAGEFADDGTGVQDAVATVLTGGAVVIRPAFAGAGITNVAASAALTEKDNNMCEKCNKVHAAGVVACETTVVGFSAAEGADLMAKVEAQAAKIAELEAFKGQVGPTVQQFSVVEEPIYRFAGVEGAPSGFDFATDMLAAATRGDAAALKRVQDFTAQAMSPDFAIKTGDVSPTQGQSKYRADMFLGQAPIPPSPLFDAFFKGALADVTPFFWSKFDRVNSNAGVADHVEGVEPADKTIKTLVGTTVTPGAVSGKVHITREVADQGGSPAASGLAWAEFDRSYKIAQEAKTAALVKAAIASYAALATIPTGTSGGEAGDLLLAGLIGLQFDPQGFRFSRGFGEQDLYTALALAKNANDEYVFPILGGTNRDGSAADKFAHVNVGGYDLYPTASLNVAGAGAKTSIYADPAAVHVWASGLQRLDKLQEDVEGWDIGCFGYFAGVVYDLDGIRKVTYTK
jgi:hypothetical protein